MLVRIAAAAMLVAGAAAWQADKEITSGAKDLTGHETGEHNGRAQGVQQTGLHKPVINHFIPGAHHGHIFATLFRQFRVTSTIEYGFSCLFFFAVIYWAVQKIYYAEKHTPWEAKKYQSDQERRKLVDEVERQRKLKDTSLRQRGKSGAQPSLLAARALQTACLRWLFHVHRRSPLVWWAAEPGGWTRALSPALQHRACAVQRILCQRSHGWQLTPKAPEAGCT